MFDFSIWVLMFIFFFKFGFFIYVIFGLCSYYDQSVGHGTENVEGEQKQV
jgi:hypothetical protein